MIELSNLPQNTINLLLPEHIDHIFETTSAMVYLKDKAGKYLAVNTVFEQTSEIKIREIIGNDDFDLYESTSANTFRKNDALILAQEASKVFFERTISNQGLSFKTPLKSRAGKIIGVLGFSFLYKDDEGYSLAASKSRSLFDIFGANSTGVSRKESTAMLTLRQYDCLYYLIKGMSAKQIAHTLGLSCRTVEDHLARLKEKFSCNTRFDLFSHALKIPYIKNKLFLDLQNT